MEINGLNITEKEFDVVIVGGGGWFEGISRNC